MNKMTKLWPHDVSGGKIKLKKSSQDHQLWFTIRTLNTVHVRSFIHLPQRVSSLLNLLLIAFNTLQWQLKGIRAAHLIILHLTVLHEMLNKIVQIWTISLYWCRSCVILLCVCICAINFFPWINTNKWKKLLSCYQIPALLIVATHAHHHIMHGVCLLYHSICSWEKMWMYVQLTCHCHLFLACKGRWGHWCNLKN